MTTKSGELQRLLYAASDTAEWASLVPTTTKPSGDGVITWKRPENQQAADAIELLFVGSDAENETFSVRVWKWLKDTGGIWWPQLQIELTITLGNIDASAFLAGGYMADTVVKAAGDASSNAILISPANDTPGCAILRPEATDLLEIELNTGGSAASMNVLYRRIREYV
ncbi:MAG: hypothetical protein H8E44_37445 [Planctomycetes bacterium]|nr:hypothetical protein [Planctomycetota bacterium]